MVPRSSLAAIKSYQVRVGDRAKAKHLYNLCESPCQLLTRKMGARHFWAGRGETGGMIRGLNGERAFIAVATRSVATGSNGGAVDDHSTLGRIALITTHTLAHTHITRPW